MSIKITDLYKSFGNNNVLAGVNLCLKDNSVYCLMGASGMGKTTLLRIIMGHEKADSGKIEGINENEISSMFQEDRLIPSLSAIENVAVVSRGKADKKEIRRRLKKILPKESLDKKVTELSGGMKRRVALARALEYPGKLIILDEPFTGLDHDTKLAIIEYILDMRNKRILLVATHGLEDAALLGAATIQLSECQKDYVSDDDYEEDDEKLSREEIFGKLRMFDGIQSEKYDDVIEKLDGYEVNYKIGDIIWHQGEKQEFMGVILSGAVQGANVSRQEQQIMERFYAGNTFGEAVAFGQADSWVEVGAVEDSRILFISAKKILENRTDEDLINVGMNCLKEMASKFAMVNMKNKLLSEPRLRNRIIMYLMNMQKNDDGTVTVPYKQKELAQYLNVNKTSFNRELARMKDEGIIDIDGHKVKLLADINPDMLYFV